MTDRNGPPGDIEDVIRDIMIMYRLPEQRARAFVLLDRGDVDVMGHLITPDGGPGEENRLPTPPKYMTEEGNE